MRKRTDVVRIASGGTSYSPITIAHNSVRSTQIAAGAVHATDVARGVVASTKVRDGSLRATDFRKGSLPVGARGPTGPAGQPGTVTATRVRSTGPVTLNVVGSSDLATPLSGNTWTQATNELDIVVGSATLSLATTPASESVTSSAPPGAGVPWRLELLNVRPTVVMPGATANGGAQGRRRRIAGRTPLLEP
jgi:hypothetical protein